MDANKPIRYGKPNLADLSPELGRMIYEAITNATPFDYSQLKKDSERINRRLARIGKGDADDITGK